MLKIRRSANRHVVFALSGRLTTDTMPEVERLICSESVGRRIVLDLKDVILVGRDAINFLERCEGDGIRLENCPAYVREWIARQRRGRS